MPTPPSPSGKAKYAWSEVERTEPPRRPVADRLADFREAQALYDEATVMAQASRCIQCPNPACVDACPLEVPIPELLSLTADGQFREAAELLLAKHSLPEFFVHICDGKHLCEASCVLVSKSEPVPIGSITRFLLDYASKHGLDEPPVAPLNGQTVAVIGAGICGLVGAEGLSRLGYAVTVMDCHQKPGGRLVNGLPGFRVNQAMIERRVELLRARGVRFRMGVVCGRDLTLSALRRDFDAVFFGLGRADPVPLDVPGAGLRGVHLAHAYFLEHTTGLPLHTPPIEVRGQRVAVLGGGDTAMDALRIAIRRGASEAFCIYRRDRANMPVNPDEFAEAEEEGARFLFQSQPVAILGNAAGEVTGLRCVRTELGETDSSGRLSAVPIPGSDFEVEADVVLVAYGFTPPKLPHCDEFAELVEDERGCLVVDKNQMTNLPGVFAGGSIVRGPIPLADAVRDARKAALAIDSYLAERRPAMRGSG